jgi:sugar lactone lactonase YvrE
MFGFLWVILLVAIITPRVFATVATGNADVVLGQPDLKSSNVNVVENNRFSGLAGVYGNGGVWIADSTNNRVLFFHYWPVVNGQGADGVIGQPDFTSGKPNRGGAAAANTLNRPYSVAQAVVGGHQYVWVADSGNNRILRYTDPQAIGATADLVLGQSDFISTMTNRGTGVAANTLSLSNPRNSPYPGSVAINRLTGDVWVADKGNRRVLKYSGSSLATGMDANLVLGKRSFTDTYCGSISASCMAFPTGITVNINTGDVWVTETELNRALRFPSPSASSASADVVLGQSDFVSTTASARANTLYQPVGISVVVNGATTYVYVADAANNRVLKYTSPFVSSGQNASVVLGQSDFVSSGWNGFTNSSLLYPVSVFSEDGGSYYAVWVADMVRVLRFDTTDTNNVSATLVLGAPDFAHASGNSVENKGFATPAGVVYDPKYKRLFVSDENNSRVLWWNTTSPLSTQRPADGVLGRAGFTELFSSFVIAQNKLAQPAGLAVDASGNLYVADYYANRVVRFPGASLATGMNADLVLGQADFTSGLANRGSSAAANTMYQPYSVAVDKHGNIWVGDMFNNRALKFSAASLANGANASLVLGQADSSSNLCNRGSSTPGDNTLCQPSGIYVDAFDRVWIADMANSRILKFDAPGSYGQSASLELGQSGFNVGTFGVISQYTLANPYSAALDAFGNVWVTDTSNSRIVKYSPPFSNAMPATSVVGQSDFTSGVPNRGGNLANANTLYSPYALAFDTLSNLYVADTANNRVTMYNSGLAITALNPSLSASADNSLTLTWDTTGNTGYVAALFSDSDYLNPVAGSSGTLTGNSKTFTGLSANTSYYFEVKISTEIDVAYNLNQVSLLTAPPPGPYVAALLLASGFNTGAVQVGIQGANFTPNTTVKLSKAGQPDITGVVAYTNTTSLTVSFNLSGAVPGGWDLVVTVPAQQPFTKAGAFAVLAPTTNVEPVKVLQGIFNPAKGDKSYIATHLASAGKVTVKVYDPGGRLVRDIFEGDRNSGDYSDEWDGRNDGGSKVASGVYLVRIEGPGFKTTKRVLVVK